jgi:hypothetical protein
MAPVAPPAKSADAEGRSNNLTGILFTDHSLKPRPLQKAPEQAFSFCGVASRIGAMPALIALGLLDAAHQRAGAGP